MTVLRHYVIVPTPRVGRFAVLNETTRALVRAADTSVATYTQHDAQTLADLLNA